MAEFQSDCPHCKQPLALDDAWAGQELQCPLCQKSFIAPGGAAPARQAGPVLPPVGGYTRNQLTGTSRVARKESGAVKKWAITAAVVVVLGAGAWAVVTYWPDLSKRFSSKADTGTPASNAGEAGPATSAGPGAEVAAAGQDQPAPAVAEGRYGKVPGARATPAEGATPKELPVVPPTWTLDLTAAKIPESRVNGSISGTNFLCDSAKLNVVGPNLVLNLRQGQETVPERDLIIYLHPKAGENISGRTWEITAEMKGATVPQVMKRWRSDPRFAPATKSFASGYAMKLEFGQIKDGQAPGKIFLALPDKEQTVAAGVFTAETALADGTFAPGAPPVAAPVAQPVDPAAAQAFQNRYGIQPGKLPSAPAPPAAPRPGGR